jgi:C-terminal peptidase prc
MTKALFKGLLALVALAVALPAARAADDAKSQAYVVIVGIDKYKDAQILPRAHAEADAQLLYDTVTDPNNVGVNPANVRLLLGSPDNKRKSELATKANILKALTWVVDNAGKDDLVIVAYIGEGAPVKERTCYFTIDSTVKDRAKDALNAGEIEAVMDKLKSHRFVGLLDVNFKGFNLGKEPAQDPDFTKMYREWLGKEDELGPQPSRLVFLPNAGTKPSLDLPQNGVFTKVIVDGLKGKADASGYEADGLITADELVKYFKKELPEAVRAAGKTDEQKGQTPLVFEAHTGDFVIAHNPAAAPLAAKRLEQFEKVAKAGNLPKEVVEEGTAYLVRMPKLEAQQSLRKIYQKLADGTLTVEAFKKERDTILASTKLTADEAGEYARKVMAAIEVVKHYYFKDMKMSQMVESAVRGTFKKLDEPMPSQIKEKLDKVKELSKADLLALLTETRRHLGRREDLAKGNDVTLALQGVMGKLDRHSDYIDPDEVARLKSVLKGKFSGIGVQIRKSPSRDQLQVITPIKGSPAYNAKIYAGDIITHIVREVDSDGKALATPEVIPTKGMSTEEAVKKITGKAGTKVKIIVEREGETKPLEFTLVRGTVEMESVVGIKRNGDDSWDYVIDPDNGICYVRLTQFQDTTGRDLHELMKKLSKVGIKGFILDLRFDPGGLLDQAVKICDLFIDDGTIVTIKPRVGPETSYMGKKDGSFTTFPMVCLVNGYSASASEIVSACLQDHNRAIIMGSRSYGKGSVQTLIPFDETGGILKITTATFWRPNGKNLNKASTSGKDEEDWGVKPDRGYDLPLSVKEVNDLQDHQRDAEIIHRPGKRPEAGTNAAFRDRQLDMALEYLRGQIKMAKGPGTKKAG